MITKSPHIKCRLDFGSLANLHDAKFAAEVGVDRGIFAKAFLDQWRGIDMYLIDSYQSYGQGGKGFAWDRESDYLTARHMVKDHLHRVRFIRADSKTGASMVRHNHSLGFIYIDAEHSYKSVVNDIAIWWPKLANGGILAGHDWNWEGVQQAVTEAFDEVYVTNEVNAPSWYVIKQ